MLGLTIDNKLSFNSRIKITCRKASPETSVLSRISGFLDLKPKESLLKGMIRSQMTRISALFSACYPQEYLTTYLIKYMEGLNSQR